MTYYYKDYVFNVPDTVYEPKEDSQLLADNLQVKNGDIVLDMGCGSGIQGITASLKAKKVLSVDINPAAVKATAKNAETNNAKT